MNVWEYREVAVEQLDLTGFDVDAVDGHIGKVDEATYDSGASWIVVDTGWWIFGKKRMIPAGAIERIDIDHSTIHVGLTKDQVKEAPDWDALTAEDDGYRDQVGDYYGRF